MSFARLAPLLWLVYLIVPVDGWGLFNGRPLGALEAVVVLLLLLVWCGPRPPKAATWAALALIAKVALGTVLLVPRGFDARYYANADFSGPPERGTEPAGPGLTRVDPRLRFGAAGAADLPTYFFNDSSRFNFYLPTEPSRATLPVSVIWDGWLRADRAGLRRLYVRTAGPATLSVGEFSAVIPDGQTEWVGYPRLHEGLQPIRLTLALPQGRARTFEAGWTVDGALVPFDTGEVFRRSASSLQLAVDRATRMGSVGLDVTFGLWLLLTAAGVCADAWRRMVDAPAVGAALTIGWVGIAGEALVHARPWLERMVTLTGGDDWLTYETRARDIALNSIWMLGGADIGQGRAFFEMPLYPYFLAATHWLFGDGLYGAMLVQRLLVGGAVIALWRITATLGGERVGCAGLVTALVVVYTKVGAWSTTLLTELLFVPVVCLAALRLMRLADAREPSASTATWAGAIGGIATMTRSTLMLGWPLVLSLVAWGLRPSRRVRQTTFFVLLGLFGVISLATLRNWVVAREFVLINAYGSAALRMANEPPASFVIPAERQATYDRLGLDENVRTVVEYARQSPAVFLDAWKRRAAYALGYFDTITPGSGWSLLYVATWAMALVGLVLIAVGPSWLPQRRASWGIPLAIALAHFGVLVLTFASVYGDRLLLAFYALLAPYAGVAAFAAHAWLSRTAGRLTALLAWVLLAGVCVWQYQGGAPHLRESVLTMAVVTWSVAVFGLPRLPTAVAAGYAGVAAALFTWAAVDGSAALQHAVALDLLLLSSALAGGVLVAAGFGRPHQPRPLMAWTGLIVTVLTMAVLHRNGAPSPVMILAGLVLGAVSQVPARVAPLVIVVGAGLGSAGCASPPSGDVALARRLYEEAAAAGAARFAASDFATARQAQVDLDLELAAQSRRWFPTYERARDLAITIQAASDAAKAGAAATRDRVVREATTAPPGSDRDLGPNLFRNATFDAGLEGWSQHPESDATASVVPDGAGGRAWTVSYRGGNWSVISQSVTLQPDTVYVYEATVRSSAPVVALYWQADTGLFHEIDKSYPDWTRLRFVLLTPAWNGEPKAAIFHPVLMKGPGTASIKDLRLSEVVVR